MKDHLVRIVSAILILVVLVVATAGVHKYAKPPAPAPQQPRTLAVVQGIADQVEAVRPAVVHVLKSGVCQGSGAIISPDGIVFTAKHVTDGTPGDYTVTLDDGRKFPVKYVVEDTENDVAFLQLDLLRPVRSDDDPLKGLYISDILPGDPHLDRYKPNLPTVPLATKDDMRVGDPLFIMGSSFGYDNFNSVSLGILSADNRNLHDREGWNQYNQYDWHVMFQSTSPAFPGNSGGPVFNLRGEVIGVLVAGQAETLNFSVPVGRFRGTIDAVRNWFQLLRIRPIEAAPEPVIAIYLCH